MAETQMTEAQAALAEVRRVENLYRGALNKGEKRQLFVEAWQRFLFALEAEAGGRRAVFALLSVDRRTYSTWVEGKSFPQKRLYEKVLELVDVPLSDGPSIPQVLFEVLVERGQEISLPCFQACVERIFAIERTAGFPLGRDMVERLLDRELKGENPPPES